MLSRVLAPFALLLVMATAASAQTRENYVTWPASSSVGTAAFTGYKIYRCNPAPCTPTVQVGTATSEQYFDLGLANGTTYRYKISAYGPGGETAQATTVDITTYGAPTTRNVMCTADITSALTTAIGNSADGDIVSISAGSCSMSGITINDKNITIQGAGQGVTNITAEGGFGQWITNGSSGPFWRLSGISLTGTGNPIPLRIWGDQAASWRGPFRIDHMDFNYPNGGSNVYIFGPVWGVIDHNSFTGGFESMVLTGIGLTASIETGAGASTLYGAFGSSLTYRPGAGDYLYIEDNVCNGPGLGGVAFVDTDRSGGRFVIRHNTLTSCGIYAHWTGDKNINSLWWEVYNNHSTWVAPNQVEISRMQGGGTGLIYNNTFDGSPGFSPYQFWIGEGRLNSQSGPPLQYCDVPEGGPQAWDSNLGDTSAVGWPCLMQTGRNAGVTAAQVQAGAKQTSFPFYLWNNGPQLKCFNPGAAGAACDNTASAIGVVGGPGAFFLPPPGHTVTGGGQGQGDVDYCINTSQPTGCGTHTLTYTPYTYPHPLAH